MVEDEADVAELARELLEGGTLEVRIDAAIVLGSIGSPEAIQALADGLSVQDRHSGALRDVITDQLVAIGAPAEPALTALLDDETAGWYAREALKYMHGHPATADPPSETPRGTRPAGGKYCRECGTQVDEAARFCAACGAVQPAVGTAAPVPSTGTSPETQFFLRPPSEARPDVAGALITIFGGVLLIVSAFLPWLSAQAFVASVSRNAFQLGDQMGFSPDGLVLVLLGLVAVLIGATRLMKASLPRWVQRSPIIVGIGALLVPISEVGAINDLARQVSTASDLATASVGFGVWLAILAAAVTVVGGFVLRK